jgi:hypothetical protein
MSSPTTAANDQTTLRSSIAFVTSGPAFRQNQDDAPMPSRAAPTRRLAAPSTAVQPRRPRTRWGAISSGIPKKKSTTKCATNQRRSVIGTSIGAS